MGRRPELIGGGLIRSLGGWDEIKNIRHKGQDRIKSDQRILGDSNFVKDVLSESEGEFSRRYKLRRLGYDYSKVVERVCRLFGVEKNYIIQRNKIRDRVKAKDLVSYWAVNELGMSMMDVARRFDVTPAAVGDSVQREKK